MSTNEFILSFRALILLLLRYPTAVYFCRKGLLLGTERCGPKAMEIFRPIITCSFCESWLACSIYRSLHPKQYFVLVQEGPVL